MSTDKVEMLAFSLDKIATKPPVPFFIAHQPPLWLSVECSKEKRDQEFNNGKIFSQSRLEEANQLGREAEILNSHNEFGAVINAITWKEALHIIKGYFPYALNAFASIMDDMVRLDSDLYGDFVLHKGVIGIFRKIEEIAFAGYADKSEMILYNAGADFIPLEQAKGGYRSNTMAHELGHFVHSLNPLHLSTVFSQCNDTEWLLHPQYGLFDALKTTTLARGHISYVDANMGKEFLANLVEFFLGDTDNPKKLECNCNIHQAFVNNVIIPCLQIDTLPSQQKAEASGMLDELTFTFIVTYLPKRKALQCREAKENLRNIRAKLSKLDESHEFTKGSLEEQAEAHGQMVEGLVIESLEKLGKRFTAKFNLPTPEKVSGLALID